MLDKIQRLKQFLGPDVVRYLFLSVFVGAIWFLVESSFIFMIQGFLLAIGLLTDQQVFLPAWYPRSLVASVIILVLFGFLRACATLLKNHISFLTQVQFTTDQRANLMEIGLKNARTVSSKEIVSIFTEVITKAGIVISSLASIINTGCALFLFFISGLKLAPYEMLTGVLLLAVFLIPIKYLTRIISRLGIGLVKEWDDVSGSLLSGLRNYFFLAIYNRIETEIEKGSTSVRNYKDHYINYSLIAGVAGAFPMFIGVIILSAITYISIQFVKTDPVKLISFFYIFIRLAQSAGEASTIVSQLKLNMPSFKRLFHWTDKFSKNSQTSKRSRKIIEAAEIMIEAMNLGFKYADSSILFQDLNFKLKKSDVLVIKGESGSGKSTLLSLILSLNQPTQGEVKINGISSGFYHIDLHKVLGYVGPEPYLIPGTVRENLMYGLSHLQVSDADMWEILKSVELYDLIAGLKLKLDEPINEIAQFSYGQRQRLAIARSLLRKPSLLILDEATANLDHTTEQKIINNLKILFTNCTSIIVTHKDSFDALATQNITLESHKASGE